MKAAVPERAMVPRFSTSSSWFMPTPLSIDGQGAGGLVGGQDDPEIGVLTGQLGLRQRGVAQPVAGIRGIGDELAQEDLLLAVERMRDDIQQAADLRLEASLLLPT